MSDVKTLLNYAYHYYVKNSPVVPDFEYDELYNKVREQEAGQEYKITDKVCLGYFEGKSAEKVKHSEPMLSVPTENDRTIDQAYVITPKLDGASLELVYENGNLVHMLTRGDGIYGSDVSKCIISAIPKKLPLEISIVIRGEVLCPNYLEYGKSHRNVVAGSMSLKDCTIDRGLHFISYWTNKYSIYETYLKELDLLLQLGFDVPIFKACYIDSPIEKPETSCKIDGYVFRVNDNTQYGEGTAHHYKGIFAHKTQNTTAITEILDVEWNMSKNGILTPVAILEPVELLESTISRLNLMHLDYIESKGVMIGDSILLRKAGEIIPELIRVSEFGEDRQPISLSCCPRCNGELVMQGVHLICPNLNCSIAKRVEFFVKTLDLLGLGEKNIEKLIEWVQHPLDLFTISEKKYSGILGVIGTKFHKQLHERTFNITDILVAFNPPGIKKTILTKMLKNCTILADLTNYEKMIEVSGVGEKLLPAFITWYKDEFELYLPIIETLNINMDFRDSISQPAMLVCVSGTFPMPRKEFTKEMEKRGIEVKGSVTKSCSMLITGAGVSESKLTKADKYGLIIVSYSRFMKDLQKD